MKSSKQGTFNFLAIVMFVVSGIMIYLGYDKMTNYYYSEYAESLNKNAYVGGDAYNYIINSNYATGFYVLALLFAVVGVGLIIIGYLDAIKMAHTNITIDKSSETTNFEVAAGNEELKEAIVEENN